MLSYQSIKEYALSLGWDDVGITYAKIPKEDIESYKKWLQQGFHGSLSYMENQMRCDPQSLLPNAKTAIIFVSHYKQEKKPFKKNMGLIASYARGRDYHNVHRKRLKKMIRFIEEKTNQKNCVKGFSDSTPILEKALAVQAGLGWFGKNTLLIHRKFGTFILLSGILTIFDFPEAKLEMRLPRCGSCTRCLDACPTQAITKPYHLDATKCLSYHLIESKDPIPKDIQEKNPGYVFGCDICQDICPHNIRKEISQCQDFSSEKGMGSYLTLQKLKEIEKEPEKLFGTPLQRRKVHGLKHSFKTISDKYSCEC